MIDWPIKSDVRRKCPIFSELSSESIDRNSSEIREGRHLSVTLVRLPFISSS